MSLSPDDPRHGTVNGYVNLRCRCDRCRQANTADHRRRLGTLPRALWEESQKAKIVHGAGRYKKGCRCDVCRKAASLRRRANRYKAGGTPHPELWKYKDEAS